MVPAYTDSMNSGYLGRCPVLLQTPMKLYSPTAASRYKIPLVPASCITGVALFEARYKMFSSDSFLTHVTQALIPIISCDSFYRRIASGDRRAQSSSSATWCSDE